MHLAILSRAQCSEPQRLKRVDTFATQSYLYSKERSESSFIFGEERDNPFPQFIAGSPKRRKFFCFGSCPDRIVDAPMSSFRRPRKRWTVLFGVIAYRDHKVQMIVYEFID